VRAEAGQSKLADADGNGDGVYFQVNETMRVK